MESTKAVPKIKFEDVSLIYDDGVKSYKAISDMSFSVDEGEFVSIIGASGCGKSSTLSVLAGLRNPTAGRLMIDGVESRGTSKNRGVVFQHYSLFPWMTAEGNVSFGIHQAMPELPIEEARETAVSYLARVGLTGFEEKYPHELSGGMQQRTAIARTIAMQPEILLLDEPFGAIDARNRVVLQDLLLEVLGQESAPKTIVLVTHDIDEAILLSDRILFMDGKSVAAEFVVPFERPRVREAIYASNEYMRLRQSLMRCFFNQASSEGAYI